MFAYHGTDPAFAGPLVRGEVAPADWSPSANEDDWLGHGIYFWEYAPDRAPKAGPPAGPAKKAKRLRKRS